MSLHLLFHVKNNEIIIINNHNKTTATILKFAVSPICLLSEGTIGNLSPAESQNSPGFLLHLTFVLAHPATFVQPSTSLCDESSLVHLLQVSFP